MRHARPGEMDDNEICLSGVHQQRPPSSSLLTPYSHATAELESLRNNKATKTTPGLAFPVRNADSMAFEQFLSQAGNLLVMLEKHKAIWV